jgi:hypothetical protein
MKTGMIVGAQHGLNIFLSLCYPLGLLLPGACPRIGIDRFVAPAKQALPPSMAVDRFVAPAKQALPPSMAVGRYIAPAISALPPSMAVVARGIHFESDFPIIMRRILAISQ